MYIVENNIFPNLLSNIDTQAYFKRENHKFHLIRHFVLANPRSLGCREHRFKSLKKTTYMFIFYDVKRECKYVTSFFALQ